MVWSYKNVTLHAWQAIYLQLKMIIELVARELQRVELPVGQHVGAKT
jgi:hypothetical protein